MRKIASSLAILLFVSISQLNLNAGSLAGVDLPDTAQVGGKTLALNGLGLRTKLFVKVYVAGLYVEQKSADANSIINANARKQIVMKFLHAASKSQMADAFEEGFSSNAPDATKALKSDIDLLLNALEPVKPGDEMVFTYVPGAGTTFTLNGKEKLKISNPAFAPALFSVWLGPKPPNADLKKGLLGQ